MTRSGPARLPSVLQLDGRRYSVESLPDEIKTLIIDLQKADAVVQNRSRTVQVLKTAHSDLKTKLQQALQQQPLAPDLGLQAPVAPMPADVPVDQASASHRPVGAIRDRGRPSCATGTFHTFDTAKIRVPESGPVGAKKGQTPHKSDQNF